MVYKGIQIQLLLKLNFFTTGTAFGLLPYSNTTLVKVKWKLSTLHVLNTLYSNTTLVKVKSYRKTQAVMTLFNSNTTLVKVKCLIGLY